MREMGRIGGLLAAVLLLPGPVVRAAEASTPQCPDRITTDQSGAPVEGWTVTRLGGGARLLNVSLSEGPPAKEVYLAPDRTDTAGKDMDLRYLHQWTLGPSDEGFWLTCHYYGTEVVLTQRLADGVRRCEMDQAAVGIPATVKVRCHW